MRETWHRIWSIVVKEFLQLSRDKLLMAFVILAPLLELALMGTLVGGGVDNLPFAVINSDYGPASRELIAKLNQSDALTLRMYAENVAQARQAMQRDQIAAIVIIPPDYGRSLTTPQQVARVQVIVDDANYVVGNVVKSTVENTASEIMQDMTAQAMTLSGGVVKMNFTARFNVALDDRPRSITAMLGMIVYQVTLIIAAQSFTRERERGTLEQLRITPLGRVELIVGKAIPTLVIGLVDSLLMIGLIALWFEVPVRGSLPLLLLLTVPFVLAQIGWGTLISLVSRNQQQAVLFVFALAMLEVACSGFLVPAADMPSAMQFVARASSVQHYLVILRGVLLRGAGVGSLWLPALALAGIATAAASIAWLRLRMGLESDSLQQRLKTAWRAAQRRRKVRVKQPPTDRQRKCPLFPRRIYIPVRQPVQERRVQQPTRKRRR